MDVRVALAAAAAAAAAAACCALTLVLLVSTLRSAVSSSQPACQEAEMSATWLRLCGHHEE